MESRYYTDQLEPFVWLLLDNQSLEVSYNMLLTPIYGFCSNWQVSIAEIEATSDSQLTFSSDENYTVYSKELFSTCFYSINDIQAINLVNSIVSLIETDELDLANLVEVAAMFGGLVNSESIILPPVNYSLHLN